MQTKLILCDPQLAGGAKADGFVDKDCWHGVQDARERKKIQDRLAQRARRRRLAQERAKADSTSEIAEGQNQTAMIRRGKPKMSSAQLAFQNLAVRSSKLRLQPIPLSIYSALWKNGSIMGLSCSECRPSVSKERLDIPELLRPTLLQQMTVHPLWIDNFPFPKMRENFILMLGIVDPEEFCADLMTMPSFTIEAGGPSWDASRWSIEKSFAEKWGYLFQSDLFETAAI